MALGSWYSSSSLNPGQVIAVNPGGFVQYFSTASVATSATYNFIEDTRPKTPMEWLDDQLYSVRTRAGL